MARDVIDRDATRIMAVILRGALRYPDIQAATGLSRSVIHRKLQHLRRKGLVTFEDDKHGTLRPAVHPVPYG